jgi:pimeloyl-ACP methyl ester carboxylesterase
MSRVLSVGAWAGAGAAVAVGGVVLDRLIGRHRLGPEDPGHEELGSLRGERFEVKTDDGLVLYAEVDEIAPYGSQTRHDHEATVVFVHGFALNMDCWHFQRQAFRGKRRMVFYDQRSHGRSGRSPKENATIDQLGRDLKAILDTLAPGEPVVLVGHSMGGMSIVAFAEQYPELFGERVVGLGLLSTTAGGQRTHKVLSRHIPDPVGRRVVERGLLLAGERERLLELARRSGSAIAFRVIREFAFGDTRVPPSYVRFVDSMIASTPLSVLVEFIPEFDALDKFHVVEAFSSVPSWVVCGTDDKLTSIGHARKLNSRIADSRLLELDGGGHMSMMEFRDRVNAALTELFEAADEKIAGER